jgi:hypothetical protein
MQNANNTMIPMKREIVFPSVIDKLTSETTSTEIAKKRTMLDLPVIPDG